MEPRNPLCYKSVRHDGYGGTVAAVAVAAATLADVETRQGAADDSGGGGGGFALYIIRMCVCVYICL